MATYQALKTRVADYLIDVPNKTSLLVGDWLNKAVKAAESHHDFAHMRATAAFTTVAGTRLLAVRPADWKHSRLVPWHTRYDGSSGPMAWAASEEDMRRQYAEGDATDVGSPQFVLDGAPGLQLYPYADGRSDYGDGEYRVKIPYWAFSPALVESTDTNWFTTRAEWYLTFYAAAEGLLFNRDTQEATIYLERAKTEIGILIAEDKRASQKQPRTLVPHFGVNDDMREPPRRRY